MTPSSLRRLAQACAVLARGFAELSEGLREASDDRSALAPAPTPRRKAPIEVTDIDRARARTNLRRRGVRV